MISCSRVNVPHDGMDVGVASFYGFGLQALNDRFKEGRLALVVDSVCKDFP
jgi:hypothetical protein